MRLGCSVYLVSGPNSSGIGWLNAMPQGRRNGPGQSGEPREGQGLCPWTPPEGAAIWTPAKGEALGTLYFGSEMGGGPEPRPAHRRAPVRRARLRPPSHLRTKVEGSKGFALGGSPDGSALWGGPGAKPLAFSRFARLPWTVAATLGHRVEPTDATAVRA